MIVNTASIAGTTPNEIVPLYAATKAAVISLTKGAAPAALAMGIRINAVAPALVDTEFAQMLIPPEPPAWMEPFLVDRIAPLEVAEAVLSLIEDDSRSGEVVIVANRPPVDRIETPA